MGCYIAQGHMLGGNWGRKRPDLSHRRWCFVVAVWNRSREAHKLNRRRQLVSSLAAAAGQSSGKLWSSCNLVNEP